MKKIKIEGFSTDDEEFHLGIKSIGAPVFNQDDVPVAAVVVTGLSHEISWDSDSSTVHLLKDTATSISIQLNSKMILTTGMQRKKKKDLYRY